MKKRVLSLVCAFALVFTVTLSPIASAASADVANTPKAVGITKYLESYDESKANDPTFTAAVMKALSDIRNLGIDANSNAVQKAYAVDQYFINNVAYDSATASACFGNELKPGEKFNEQSASAYGALVNHRAVCEGIADAYKLLMNALGVPTIAVHSPINVWGHDWNMVDLNGKWYHLDASQDIGFKSVQIFLKSSKFMGGTSNFNSGFFNFYGYPTGGMPVANDETYDAYDFSNTTLADLASWMPATPATMSLDTTTTYHGAVGHSYTFAVNSNINELAFATSTNPNVQVSAPVYESGKQLYTISFKAPCSSTINVTSASGLTASFPVVVTAGNEGFTCDTKGTVNIKMYGTYTFMITSNTAPKVSVGYGLVDTIAYKKVGNKHYYTLKAYGEPGFSTGIYINGLNVPAFIVKIVNP